MSDQESSTGSTEQSSNAGPMSTADALAKLGIAADAINVGGFVKTAGATESADDTADEPAPAVEPAQTAPEAEAADAEPEDPTVFAIKARAHRQAQREREAAKVEAAQMRAQAQRELQEAQEMRAQYTPIKDASALMREKPIEALKRMGMNPRDVLDGLVGEVAPDPMRDHARALAELKAQIESQKAEVEAWKEQQSTARQQAAYNDAVRQVDETTSNAEEFPILSKLMKGPLRATTIQALAAIEAEYTDESGPPKLSLVAKLLEKQYGEVYSTHERTELSPAAPGKASQGKPRPVAASRLTARESAPEDFSKLPPKEQKKRMEAVALQAFEKFTK